MSVPMNINNAMGYNGGEPITGGTGGSPVTVTPVAKGNITVPFSSIRAINGNLVISAITCAITYTNLLPITLAQGEVLYCPGCTTVSSTGGQGVALYT